ncbi:hypothetical protein GCK72_009238 [Caenorhabditis remanei]|uniref:SPK domain-containing protein n=1 Tax=Caenorhabditis remanei TaxID=31234 RepID=A0A6A5H214_CAERE|nr:hypothetical protein GCK72_009238 [Caenorhabditis remanei]KAF1760985.1 hypothetical protein GCK72_009238 [Caenorhabditis remanei]
MTCGSVYTPYVRKGFAQFMEETNELLAFVIESTKNEITPVNVRELCQEFKEATDNPNSELSLMNRLQTLKIHEMNNLTIDTKVRLIFVMSIPIDPDFFCTPLLLTPLAGKTIRKPDFVVFVVFGHAVDFFHSLSWEQDSLNRSEFLTPI